MLVYTSMPERGLGVLLDAFSSIQSSVPDVHLRVYSGGGLYRLDETEDSRVLFERCTQMQGVEYIGPLGQAQLADQLADAAALAYPAIVRETFCLAAAEAMSLGATLLTTRVGALPELFGTFSFMVDPVVQGRLEFVQTYARLVINALAEARRDPLGFAKRRKAQIAFIRKTLYLAPRSQRMDRMA
jgi:glycosyltransferase involved in cell wall biosynthesis